MAVERYEVRVFEEDMKCDICGRGYYRSTGVAHPAYPLIYPHKCTFCGAMMDVKGYTFPKMVTERIEK